MKRTENDSFDNSFFFLSFFLFFIQTQINMSSSNRQASLSPSERQRIKSRSSSRSHRTPPSIIVEEEDTKNEKTSSPTFKRNTRETNRTKRSESSTSNQSTNVASPISNKSKKQRSKGRTSKSKSPSPNRKGRSKKKKTSIIINDTDNSQVSQLNDTERQDLTARGLTIVPAEIFERKSNLHFFFFS
jgi:hypothetical protein